jgi:hypothetical protein
MKIKKKSKIKKIKTTVPCIDDATKKEINRILNQNMRANLTEEGNEFAKHFLAKLLREQETNAVPSEKTDPGNFTPEKNKEDFEKSLDSETPADEYDVEGISPDVRVEGIKKIDEIRLKLDEFVGSLNDPSRKDSLHRMLADEDRPGSLLRGITRKTSDAITRVAGELEKIKEVLNSFINLAPKKIRDTEQISNVS